MKERKYDTDQGVPQGTEVHVFSSDEGEFGSIVSRNLESHATSDYIQMILFMTDRNAYLVNEVENLLNEKFTEPRICHFSNSGFSDELLAFGSSFQGLCLPLLTTFFLSHRSLLEQLLT